MVDYTEEDGQEQEPLYTEADTLPATDSNVGNYSTLKAIVTAATGKTDIPDEVEFNSFVDQNWRSTVPESNRIDNDTAINAATNGNVSVVQEALTSMAARNALYGKASTDNANEVRAKLRELTNQAVENSVAKNYGVLVNNTPEQISTATDDVSKRLTADSTIEKAVIDGSKWSNIISGLAYEFTPFAAEQGPAIDRVAIKYGVPEEYIDRTTGRSQTKEWLQNVYNSLPNDKKEEWLTGLYKDLQDSWLITDWQAALTIKEVTEKDASEWDGLFDWFDRLGVVGTLAGGVLAFTKATKGFKTAKNLSSTARTIAKAGGKEALVTAEAVKIASKAANSQRLQALGVVAGEVTGINVAIDLGKLVGLNVAKVLPESIVTASETLQKVVREPVEKLIAELQDVVAAKGVRSEEAAEQLKAIEATYAKANNPNVHSVDNFKLSEDATTIEGKVLYKPNNATAFLTEEAATNYIKSLPLDQSKGMKVVPDTTNTGFLVEESVKVDLKARAAALEAQILEEVNKAARAEKRRLTAEKRKAAGVATAAPKGLLDVAHTTPTGGTLAFESAVDKAIYTKYSAVASKVDQKTLDEINKFLTDNTGWNIDSEKSHFKDLQEHINSLAENADGRIDVTNITPSRESGFQPRPTVGLSRMGYLDNIDDTTTVGNITLGKSVPKTDAINFLSKMSKALGMDGRRIIVLNMSDVKALSKTSNVEMQALQKSIANYKKAGGLHYAYGRNVSIIVMNDTVPMTKTRSGYMETLAHEFGHAFEAHFSARHFDTINRAFNKFLKGRKIGYVGEGINKKITDAFSIDALLEYRSITNADQLKAWVDAYMNGNTAAYKSMEKDAHEWLTSYSEFFAENFAKWAFTDKVPTDIIGQTFKSLVDGFKLIVQEINNYLESLGVGFRITGKADTSIARMLNKHIKLLQEESVQVKASMSLIANEAKRIKRPSVETLQKELAAIKEELAAISDAESGLKTGWLVEKPVSKTLDYTAVGKYSDEDINSASRFSLGDWALSTSKELYSERLVGINQQSRYLKLLTNFVRPSIEKLSRADKVALDNVLVLGDKEGKVFSEAELAGSDLSAAGREAYYKVRALRDVMYQMRNDVAVKSLIRKGFEKVATSIKFDGGDGSFFGKVVTPAEGKFVYIADTNSVQRVTPEFLKESQAKGYVFYQSNEPQEIAGKSRTLFAVKDGEYTTSKIASVIPYRAGEYRRIYSDEYFVKLLSSRMVDDEMQASTITHRTASSIREAKAYADAFNEAYSLHKAGRLTVVRAEELMQGFGWNGPELIEAFNANKFGDSFKIEVRYNRTDDDYLNETVGIGSTPINSRGDRVLSVHGEDTVNTLSPLDAIASEISNTAYVASATEWRESHIRRWFNTFQDILPADVASMDPEQAFRYMLNNKGRYIGQDKRMAVAQKVQDYIIDQMNIPTKEERATIGTMRLLSESVEGLTGNRAVAKVGMALRATKNYATWARTVAFHSFFALNPVQFFMQGMNAFNAVAVSPLHGLRAAKTSSMYAMALMSDQPEIWEAFAKANKLSNLGLGMDTEEFVEAVAAIRRSGLLDGLNTTSLYGAETGKYGLFNGLTRRAGAVSAVPFNAGEGYSRLVSFDIARREFMEANKGVAWWTDDSIAKILSRQDDLTQNMTIANTSFWQKGILSIPAQFTQYQIKLMMNVVQSLLGNSRVFTRKEATQLLITHGVVMGTAGNFMWPFREEIESSLPADLTETQRLTIQQGVLAGVISALTEGEVKLALGTRFNTFKYYEDLLKGLLDPEKKFLEVIGGPSGFAAARILGGFGEAVSIIAKAPMTATTMELALIEIGKNSFSFFNNIQKMRIAQANYNQVMSSGGDALFRVTDAEAYFVGLGIPPVAQTDLSIMYESSKAHKSMLEADAKAVGKYAMLALTALNRKDDESHRSYAAVVQAILNSYTGTDLQALMKEAYKGEAFTQYEKMVIDQMVKQWSKTDFTVDTGENK
jgi:hypothetical protein